MIKNPRTIHLYIKYSYEHILFSVTIRFFFKVHILEKFYYKEKGIFIYNFLLLEVFIKQLIHILSKLAYILQRNLEISFSYFNEIGVFYGTKNKTAFLIYKEI